MADGTPVTTVEVVIFGGGAAGLWLLDELRRLGYSVLLLEASQLGAGQTVASQGIIHGGLKYTLGGLLTPSARAIRHMPTVWRRSLAGERGPDLTGTRRRAEYCHLWQTGAITSRIGMIGARAGLRIRPVPVEPAARPEALARCPGVVARIDEQVIDPNSFISNLADQHQAAILRIDADSGLELIVGSPGQIEGIRLIDPESGDPLDLEPGCVVLAAGSGNADLLERVGLHHPRMQRRPLHMVVVRGELPELNGHCVDGVHVRATITTAIDYADRTIWQIGGEIAERGVAREPAALMASTRATLASILPGVDLVGLEWATYRADRAEPEGHGRRPTDVATYREGNTIAAWPTKLALVPRLTEQILKLLPPSGGTEPPADAILRNWPRPVVAAPPWEEDIPWSAVN